MTEFKTPAEVLALVMDLIESCDPHVQATKAYRDKMVSEGFSDTAAEQMAMDFHRLVMAAQVAK